MNPSHSDSVDRSFAGKAVLVTGASSGIGAAISVGFGKEGAKVALHYNSNVAVHQVAAQTREAGAPETVVLRGDFTDPSSPGEVVGKAAEALDGLDVLVNNAGDLVGRRPLQEVDDEFLQRVLQVNFCSIVQTCRAAWPLLRRRSGVIVNITSIAAATGGGGNSGIYAAAKGAATSFTRALAKDLAVDGIRVNAVSPGVIETPIHDRHTDPSLLADLEAQVPMRRLGSPEECVGAVLFLASNAASSYVSGQILEVNGGIYMR